MPDVRTFVLPDLGEGLEEGEIVAWNVAVGDRIELNQAIVQVETAKAVVDIPSPFAGTVVETFGAVGETLLVGKPLIKVDLAGGAAAPEATPGGAPSPAQAATATGPAEAEAAAPAKAAEEGEGRQSVLVGYGASDGGGRRRRRRGVSAEPAAEPAAVAVVEAPAPAGDAAASTSAPSRPKAAPPVRKLARDLGVDLATIGVGSGPNGNITRDDVRAAASGNGGAKPAAAAPAVAAAGARTGTDVPVFGEFAPGDVIPVRGIRARIGEKMAASRRTIPEATASVWADCTELWDARLTLTDAARAEGHDVKVTPFALVLRAAVLALRRFPTLNARLDEEAKEIRLHEQVNIGFAADTPRGLIVPVIKDAHARSTLSIALELSRLADAARDGSVKPDELSGGTFTVSNYGAFGNDDGNPVINHPESAILGVGAMKERPWVVDGVIAVRRTVKLVVAFDHRISDGGEAGRFVSYIGALIEDPARILLHA